MGDVSSSASTLQMATSAQVGGAVAATFSERWLLTDNSQIIRFVYEVLAYGGRIWDLGAARRGLSLVRPTVSSYSMAPIQERMYEPVSLTECPSSGSSINRRRDGERIEACPSSGSSIELGARDSPFADESNVAMREQSPACSVDYGGGTPSPSAASPPPFTTEHVEWNGYYNRPKGSISQEMDARTGSWVGAWIAGPPYIRSEDVEVEPQPSSASMRVAPRSKYGASPRPAKPKVPAVPMTPPKASFPPREKWMDVKPPPPPGPPPGKRGIGLVDVRSVAAVKKWIGPARMSSRPTSEIGLKKLPYDCSLLEEAECLYCKEDASRVCAACSAAVCDRKRCSCQIRKGMIICTNCLDRENLLMSFLKIQGLLEGVSQCPFQMNGVISRSKVVRPTPLIAGEKLPACAEDVESSESGIEQGQLEEAKHLNDVHVPSFKSVEAVMVDAAEDGYETEATEEGDEETVPWWANLSEQELEGLSVNRRALELARNRVRKHLRRRMTYQAVTQLDDRGPLCPELSGAEISLAVEATEF